MAAILAVGIASLDIIHVTDRYPAEDEEVRALSQRVARGGNAANTLDILAQLGHACHWLGVLGDDPEAERIAAALAERGIGYGYAPVAAGGRSPVSYITVSRATGSRTIVHHRDLPELSARDWACVPLSGVDWLHFEGRNVAETRAMIQDARARAPRLPISLELEKPREGLEELVPRVDVAIYGQAYVEALGYTDPSSFLRTDAASEGLAFCAWGAEGAWLRTMQGDLCHESAHPPERLVDTVGAGDVFNAGIIHGLLAGHKPTGALRLANRLAGAKCGREGLEGVPDAVACPR